MDGFNCAARSRQERAPRARRWPWRSGKLNKRLAREGTPRERRRPEGASDRSGLSPMPLQDKDEVKDAKSCDNGLGQAKAATSFLSFCFQNPSFAL